MGETRDLNVTDGKANSGVSKCKRRARTARLFVVLTRKTQILAHTL